MKQLFGTLILTTVLFAGCSSTTPTTPSAKPSTNPTGASPMSGKVAGFVEADLAQHSTQSDCWFSIDGGVYDVTNYINVHPGGSELIIKYCGKDATSAFHTMDGRGQDHPTQATAQLQNYYKGVLN